ncbi:MAG: 50S ribosomal protein L15 [Ardenticatenia bacterium]|nr:50S ribosomal protein L15 [Ardenticatenia bacterium]
MRLHDLRPAPGSTKRRKRVARGNAGKGGTYAGRGRKGQGARSGGTKQPWFRGMSTRMNRVPYARGVGFRLVSRTVYRIVNVERLNDKYADGEEVTPDNLLERGLIKKGKSPVKVLGQGELRKALTVNAHAFSGSAREKIEAAGGRAVEVAWEEG